MAREAGVWPPGHPCASSPAILHRLLQGDTQLMTKRERLYPLLAVLLLVLARSGAAETPETILIRATLGNELSGHRRGDAELALSGYHPEAVIYDARGNADPRAWVLLAEDRAAVAQTVQQDLLARRYETERTLPFMAVRGAEAVVTSLDSGAVIDRTGGLQRTGTVRRCWFLRKEQTDWLITAQVDNLGDSLLAVPASGTPDPEVAAALAQEEQAWEAGKPGAVAEHYDEWLTGFDGTQTARPETWRVLFAGLGEWRLWLERRLANTSYTLDRQVIFATAGPARRQALALTREKVTTGHRLGDQADSVERTVLWLLVRRGSDWKVYTFCYNLRLPD